MKDSSLEVPLGSQCELPVLATPTHNALGPPIVDDDGVASFAVPLAFPHPMVLVSEDGDSQVPVGRLCQEAPPLLVAWAPRHPSSNSRRDLLAVTTSESVRVLNIGAPASHSSFPRLAAGCHLKRPKQMCWLRQEGDLERGPGRLTLCVSTANKIHLFAMDDEQRDSFTSPAPILAPYRVITSLSTVDGFVWIENEVLLVMAGGRMHVVRDACQNSGEKELQLPVEEDRSMLSGPAVRGRCIGMVGTGGEWLLVVASEQCSLQQRLQQQGSEAGGREGLLNSTVAELQRAQRRPPVSRMQELAAADAQEEEGGGGGVGSSEGVIDLVGKVRANATNTGGLLLSNLLGGLRVSEGEQQEQPLQPPLPHGTLSLVRLPSSETERSYPLLKEELASVPLLDPSGSPGVWSPSMMATEGDLVVVGSHLSPTLLAYRLHRLSLKALTPLGLPEGYRPRGLAIHKGRAFCLAAKRCEPERGKGGGRPVTAGRAWYTPSLFRFDLRPEEAAVLVAAEDAVLAFLKELKGEVLGRLDALEARLGRLEARVCK